MKKNKVESLIMIIFFIVGAVFFVVGIAIGVNTLSKDGKIETVGTITYIERYRNVNHDISYRVFVEYEADGEMYESELNYYSSGFREGMEIDIYYYEDEPEKIGSPAEKIFVIIFPISVFILISISGIMFFYKKAKNSKMKRLIATGEKVYANIVDVVVNTSYSVNGRHPLNIICEWKNPKDGETYRFKSDNLWKDVERMIIERNMRTIPVYLNPSDIREYYVYVEDIKDTVIDLT